METCEQGIGPGGLVLDPRLPNPLFRALKDHYQGKYSGWSWMAGLRSPLWLEMTGRKKKKSAPLPSRLFS